MIEEWKDVPGYEGLYRVSNLGNVYSCKRNRPMKQNDNGSGHLVVLLYKDGKPKINPVHRLVAGAFIPNPFNLPIVHHLDDNPQNNHVSNLKWCTQKENVHYTIAAGKHGTMNRRRQ
jgi:hypothetical protein